MMDYAKALENLNEHGSAGCIFEVGELEIRSALELAMKVEELMEYNPPNRWSYGAHKLWDEIKAATKGTRG